MEQSKSLNSEDRGVKGAKGTMSSLVGGDLIGKAEQALDMNEDHLEGKTTKAIENQTSKIPSGFFLTLAIGSMAVSAIVAASSKRKDVANFVGLWAPSFLMLGLYNKIVKTQGSDSHSPA
jgi:hypothetical protein